MSRIVPTTPDNNLTPSFSSVPSSNGFSSGDLVYYKDSNFGVIPANAVSTGTFNISSSVVQTNFARNATVTQTFTDLNSQTSTKNRSDFAAKLSNGNIVIIGGNTLGTVQVYYKIIDQNNNVVVASTALGIYTSGKLTVCALTGGGFVVGSIYSSSFYYGVYSNTGTVVTQGTDTFLGTNTPAELSVTSLSNGGFVFGTVDSTFSQLRTKVFSSTGVGGVTTSGNVNVYPSRQFLNIASFSDNSFVVLLTSNSGYNYLNLSVYDTTGAYVSNSNVITNQYSGAQFTMTASTNGTQAVVAWVEQDTGSYYQKAKIYTRSTNSFGSEVYMAGSQGNQTAVELQGIAGGGYVGIGSTNSYGLLYLSVYNSSLSAVTNYSMYGMPGVPGQTNYAKYTIVDGTDYVTILFNSVFNNNYYVGSVPRFQWQKASPYALRSTNSSSLLLGTASANVNGYARGASTPNSASFLAASTQTLSVNASSGFSAPFATRVTDNVQWQNACAMQDGRFVVTYLSSGAAKFIVFNNDGTIYQAATTYNTGFPTQGGGRVNCVCLENGKLVLFTANTSNSIIYFYIYSSTYQLLVSGNTSTASYGSSFNNPTSFGNEGFDVASVGGNRFVVVGSYAGSYTQCAFFDDSGTFLSNPLSSYNISSVYGYKCGSNGNGTVIVQYFSAGYGAGYQVVCRPTGTNTWDFDGTANQSVNSSSANPYASNMVVSPSNIVFASITNSATQYIGINAPYNGSQQTYTSMGTFSGQVNTRLSIGRYGQLIAIEADASYQRIFELAPTPNSGSYGGTLNLWGSYSVGMSDYNTSFPGPCPTITMLYDNTCAITYITTSGYMKVGIYNLASSTYSTTITAGVTACNPALYPSPANGYYLSGVAASDCTAGGVGVIQTNGSTTLNSQYPAATSSQAFDFTTNTISGVRGTIAGRNVVLKGS